MLEPDDFATHARKPRPKHPAGYEPGFEWDGRKGWIVTDPTTERTSPAFEALLTELGFDPATHEIVGPIQVRRWQQTPGTDYLYYHRATIALRSSDEAPDVDELVARIRQRRPRKATQATGIGSDTGPGLTLWFADWQAGKGDGDGIEGLADRLSVLPDLIDQQCRDLRKMGRRPEIIYPCFLGDLRESCGGHYAQQQFRTVLDNRDQRKVIREGADRIIDACSALAPRVAVKVVGGNHGEERQGNKSATTFADNVDVAVIEDVAYAYSHSDRYSNVTFAIPNDDLTATFDHDGLIVGMAHGHQAGLGGGDPRTKIHNWWKGQMDGQQPIGDADILVTGHFHHFWAIRRGSRTHFGAPALDGGSDWFRSLSGQECPPATLSFVVTGQGWSDVQLLA